MTKLVVTTDFSTRSRKAIKEAIKMSKKLKRAEITVVFVLEYNVPHPLYDQYQFLLPDADSIQNDLKKFLKGFPSKIKGLVVTAPTVVQGIIRVAKSEKADVILISSHGHGAVGTLVLGSTAQKLIAKSPLPVVVVR